MRKRCSILLLGCLLTLILVLLSPLASKSPDGLMKVIGEQGIEEMSGPGSRLQTILMGFGGALSAFGLAYGLARLLIWGAGTRQGERGEKQRKG
jgi:hypothetical protein